MALPGATGAATQATVEEEAIRARIMKKQHRRNTHALTRGKNPEVRAMAGLPPEVEKEASNGKDNDVNENSSNYGKGAEKEKGQPWIISTMTKHDKF
ncbi:Pyrophosphate-energized vacuolar membrane proton pump [Hordeum vulgare]|nr:Pyrophosphate-energized vacuolar membrane proton pump [Hordeum vulgare]